MKKWLVIGFALLSCSLNASNMKWGRYVQQTLIHHNEIPGWCSREKARYMMELIYQTHPQICVEIGVFAGASIYPTTSALRFHNKGIVYAIDPWSNAECIVGYQSNEPEYFWWKKVDLEKVYENFKSMINLCEFNKFCTILRMSSREALPQFADESIDILHIDGNHTEQAALMDIEMYLPKVKKGGYIWFDDFNWDSTSKAIELLATHCSQTTDITTPSCFLFRKL